MAIIPDTQHLPVRREQPFFYEFEIEALDLTGYTFRSEWRANRETTGDAAVELTSATAPDEGISVSVETVEGIPFSTIQYRVDEATINALIPFVTPSNRPNRTPGDLVTYYYDLRAEKADATDPDLRKITLYDGEVRITAGKTKDA